MYFIYLKTSGAISNPVCKGEPDSRSLDKEPECGVGSGVKWDDNDLFYAPDDEFPDDFQEWAATGKYYVDNDEIKENLDWVEPEEEEWR